jgi:hypothetical protein
MRHAIQGRAVISTCVACGVAGCLRRVIGGKGGRWVCPGRRMDGTQGNVAPGVDACFGGLRYATRVYPGSDAICDSEAT